MVARSYQVTIPGRLPAESQKTARIGITLNGEQVDISFAPYKTLLEVLREDLNHTGNEGRLRTGRMNFEMSGRKKVTSEFVIYAGRELRGDDMRAERRSLSGHD